jgi:hypothetical protein
VAVRLLTTRLISGLWGVVGRGKLELSESPKVRRARDIRERLSMEVEAAATRQTEEQLNMLFDDTLSAIGSGAEQVVDFIEGQGGIIHEIGVFYIEESGML